MIRPYGMRFEPYLPYFQQGLALYNLGRYDAALEAWKESEDQGAIDHKKNGNLRRALEELKSELNLALPQRAERLLVEVAQARREMQRQRASVSSITGELATGESASSYRDKLAEIQEGLAAAAELLKKNRVAATDTGQAEVMVRTAWERLAASHESIRDLARREEERRVEAARRASVDNLLGQLDEIAGEIAAEADCPASAGARIKRIMVGAKRLSIDLATSGRAPHFWLTQVSVACGELEEARLHLEEARSEAAVASEIPALEELVRKAVARAEWSKRYELGRERVATGACDPQLVEDLASLESAPEASTPLPLPTPRLLIANAELSCQQVNDAEAALSRVRHAGLDLPEQVAQVARRLEEVKLDAEQDPWQEVPVQQKLEAEERRHRRLLLARLEEIEKLLTTDSCQRAPLLRLEAMVGDGFFGALASEGLSQARPYLALAHGYLACGELDESRRYIAQARSTPTDDLQERAIASLVEAVETADHEHALQAMQRRAISTYTATVSEIGEGCDRSVIDEIDRVHAALGETAALANVEALETALGMPYTPFLHRVRVYLECGDKAAARESLLLARGWGRARPSTLNAFENLLSRDDRLKIYANSFALLIGAVDYVHGWAQLPGVKDDIKRVQAVLERQDFEVEVVWNPKKKELASRLEDFIAGRGTEPDSRLIVYYAGHGWSEANWGRSLGYIVPVDSPTPGQSSEHLRFLVSMEDFKKYAVEARARDVVFIFDSCFSGTVFNAAKARLIEKVQGTSVDDLLSRPARLFLTAGDEQQEVPDESAFRVAVVAGLGGSADANLDGLVLGRELGRYVAEMGRSPRSNPQWGFLDDPSFGESDVGFKALKMSVPAEF